MLSSLWYEYEQQLEEEGNQRGKREEEDEEEDEALTVESEDISVGGDLTDSDSSTSTFDPVLKLTGSPSRAMGGSQRATTRKGKGKKSVVHFSPRQGTYNDDNSASSGSSSGIGILHRSHTQDDAVYSTVGEKEERTEGEREEARRRKRISGLLISHGSILPSRSPLPNHRNHSKNTQHSPKPSSSPFGRESGSSVLSAPPSSPGGRVHSSSIDSATLRSLSSIKIKKETASSLRRKSARIGKGVLSSSGAQPLSQRQQQQQQQQQQSSDRSPPPPPPPTSSPPTQDINRDRGRDKGVRDSDRDTHSYREPDASLASHLDHRTSSASRNRTPVSSARKPSTLPLSSTLPSPVDPVSSQASSEEETALRVKQVSRIFSRWYWAMKETSNLRLLADNHFFKQHVSAVFDSFRQKVATTEQIADGTLFFQQKTLDSLLRHWVNRVVVVKEQEELVTFMEDYFLRRLQQKYFVKCRVYYDVADQAKSTLIRHFSGLLHDALSVWQDSLWGGSDNQQSHQPRRQRRKHQRGDPTPHQDEDSGADGPAACRWHFLRWRTHFIKQCNIFDSLLSSQTHHHTVCGHRVLRCLHEQVVQRDHEAGCISTADRHYFVTHTARVFIHLKHLLQERQAKNKAIRRRSLVVARKPLPSLASSQPTRRSSVTKHLHSDTSLTERHVRTFPTHRNKLEVVSEGDSSMASSKNTFNSSPFSAAQSQSPSSSTNNNRSRNRNMSIFSKCFVSEDNEHDLRALFDEIDVDHSGTIDFDELYAATVSTFPGLQLTADDVQEMIVNADLNDDGVIDFDEFCIIMGEAKRHVKTKIATTRRKFNATRKSYEDATGKMQMKRSTGPEGLRVLFNKIDKDGSGTIDTGELYTSMKQSFSSLNLTVEDVQHMMQKADLNNDGVIDFDEFSIIMGDAENHAKRMHGPSGGKRIRKMSVFSKNVVDEDVRLEMRSLFDKIDSDGSGAIETAELYVSMKQSFSALNLTVEDVQNMMKRADLNDDGVIDFEEFCVVMENTKAVQSEQQSPTGKFFSKSEW